MTYNHRYYTYLSLLVMKLGHFGGQANCTSGKSWVSSCTQRNQALGWISGGERLVARGSWLPHKTHHHSGSWPRLFWCHEERVSLRAWPVCCAAWPHCKHIQKKNITLQASMIWWCFSKAEVHAMAYSFSIVKAVHCCGEKSEMYTFCLWDGVMACRLSTPISDSGLKLRTTK